MQFSENAISHGPYITNCLHRTTCFLDVKVLVNCFVRPVFRFFLDYCTFCSGDLAKSHHHLLHSRSTDDSIITQILIIALTTKPITAVLYSKAYHHSLQAQCLSLRSLIATLSIRRFPLQRNSNITLCWYDAKISSSSLSV